MGKTAKTGNHLLVTHGIVEATTKQIALSNRHLLTQGAETLDG